MLALAVCGILPAQSDQIATPKPGSAERKAIMDGLRIPIERQLHQKVIFVVTHLKVKGNWAFTITIPKQPNGRAVDYQKTIYKSQVKPGESVGDAFSGEVVGLLRKHAGRWKTVDYCIGPSDVCWEGWDKKYGAPAAIMRIK
jgi:hypothetical protein